jgi:hypothetical protein
VPITTNIVSSDPVHGEVRFQGNGAQPLSAIFQYIMAVSFIGAGDQSTWRKPPTCRKSLTNLDNNVRQGRIIVSVRAG